MPKRDKYLDLIFTIKETRSQFENGYISQEEAILIFEKLMLKFKEIEIFENEKNFNDYFNFLN